MVVLNSGILASQAKEFGIYDFPFMFASPKEADAIRRRALRRMLHQKLEAKGIVGLAYWELGFFATYQQQAPDQRRSTISRAEDAGDSQRDQCRLGEGARANPTPLPFPRCTPRSTEGDRRAGKPATVISANKLYEAQKHIVLRTTSTTRSR